MLNTVINIRENTRMGETSRRLQGLVPPKEMLLKVIARPKKQFLEKLNLYVALSIIPYMVLHIILKILGESVVASRTPIVLKQIT